MKSKLWGYRVLMVLPPLLAWLGTWGAWIPDRSAGLQQNVYDFAEWATYLNDVRFGGLGGTPDLLRMGVALGAVVLAFSIRGPEPGLLDWGGRLLAVLTGIALLPPYPGSLSPLALQSWLSVSYRWQFLAAMCALIGAALSVFPLRPVPQTLLVIVLSTSAIILALHGFNTLLLPFEAHYARPLAPGWGALLFYVGLGIVVVSHTVWVLEKHRPAEMPAV